MVRFGGVTERERLVVVTGRERFEGVTGPEAPAVVAGRDGSAVVAGRDGSAAVTESDGSAAVTESARLAVLTELERLTSLLPPPGRPSAVVWEGVAASWGSRLPADYAAFMDLYGPGTIEDCLVVEGPEAWHERLGDGMSAESRTARLTWDKEPEGRFATAMPPRLVAWGVSDSADILCWDAASGTPEEWPVVVWNRHDGCWTRFACGMVQFLADLIEGRVEPVPPGLESLDGMQIARMIPQDELRRTWAAGIDPWAG